MSCSSTGPRRWGGTRTLAEVVAPLGAARAIGAGRTGLAAVDTGPRGRTLAASQRVARRVVQALAASGHC